VSLRILHLLASPHLGGAEIMCFQLCTAQIAMGNQVAIFAFTEGKASETAQSMGIPLIAYRGKRPESKRLYRRALEREMNEAISSFKPDIVHSHVPISNLIASRGIRTVPWVTTIHGSWKQFAYSAEVLHKPYLKPYLLCRHAVGDFWTTRRAAKIFAISDYVRSELRHIGISADRIKRVHNGIPSAIQKPSFRQARETMRISPEAFAFGSLGHFAPVKGFDLLVHAFAKLALLYPRLELYIAGGDMTEDQSVRHSLNQIAHRNSVENRVHLLGALDGCEDFLSSLDLFVVSSRTEGFSLALAQAMQCGKASVVTSAGGCIEAARPGLESLVFQSGDVQSLAQEIEKLIQDNNLRNSLAASALDRANNYLTIERCAKEYDLYYHEIVNA
jgi:glycosyltransferase involved in cell wall biosynthesis